MTARVTMRKAAPVKGIEWMVSFGQRKTTKMSCWHPNNMPGRWVHSRERITKLTGTTARRRTASCLPGTMRSAKSVSAPLSELSECTPSRSQRLATEILLRTNSTSSGVTYCGGRIRNIGRSDTGFNETASHAGFKSDASCRITASAKSRNC